MKKYLFLFLTMFVLSCAKERTEKPIEQATNLTTAKAKIFYDSLTVNKTIQLAKTTEQLNKFINPYWSDALSSRVGDYDVVEVPVSLHKKEITTYTIGLNQGQNNQLRSKNSFSRLIIYKKNGITKSNIITYIPDEEYIKSSTSAMMKNRFSKLDKLFSGFIEFKDLTGVPTRLLRIEKGIVTNKYQLSPSNSKSVQRESSVQSVMACFQICTPIWGQICAGPGGPGTGFEEDMQCWDTYLGENCYLACDGGGDTGPLPGGGGSGGDNGQPNDIVNDIKDPCLKAAVDGALSAGKDIKGALADIIHNFDANKNIKINITDGQTVNGTRAETNGTSLNPNTNQFTANITLQTSYYGNTTQETVASALIHEFVHAYINYSGNNALNNHDQLAANYITPMAEFLKSAYGLTNAAAYSLAWSGVPDSSVWSNAQDSTPFALGDTGESLTKGELTTNSSKYNDYDFFKLGTPLCN